MTAKKSGILALQALSLLVFLTSTANSEPSLGGLLKNVKTAVETAKCALSSDGNMTRSEHLQNCITENYINVNETKCYDELGCFPMDYPWTTLLRPLPSPLSPTEINTRLYCYTRSSTERYNVTLWPEISMDGCPFDANKTSVFISHGFLNNGNYTWMDDMKDAYLNRTDANVFLVDWGEGAEILNYLLAASNTRIVGAELGRFINYLQSEHELDPSKVHLIGHSLGAHISAYAANNVTGLYRITALDPAQPGFEGQNKTVRLDKDDAEFVDVLHTNAMPFLPFMGFGCMSPVGHIDFYLNGGRKQPGCAFPELKVIKSIDELADFSIDVLNTVTSCSHSRAYHYFTEAMQENCTIWGRLVTATENLIDVSTMGLLSDFKSTIETCDSESCVPIGLDTPNYNATGIFAAVTPKRSPFCDSAEESTKVLSEIAAASAKALSAVAEEAEKVKEKVSGWIKKLG